jgi:hypothetical protein
VGRAFRRRCRAGEQKLARSRSGVYRSPYGIEDWRDVLPLIQQDWRRCLEHDRRVGFSYGALRWIVEAVAASCAPQSGLRLSNCFRALESDCGQCSKELVELGIYDARHVASHVRASIQLTIVIVALSLGAPSP